MRLFAMFGLSFLMVLQTACGGSDSSSGAPPQTGAAAKIKLGKLLFEDVRLSANGNQSCASCHDASAGFADPDVTAGSPVSEGSIASSFGNRNAPTSAYAGFAPVFGKTRDSAGNPVFVGGQFMDGRRDTLEEQAKDPFLNMDEMANPNKQAVVDNVETAIYADDFKRVYGADVFNNTNTAYDRIAEAIAAFERSPEMNKFNSKFDCYLQDAVAYPLTTTEQAGLDAFNDKKFKCSSCHSTDPDPVSGKVLLTNHQYFNIGVPKNPDNPDTSTDRGLGERLVDANEYGKFKTPTLRNIELTAPYMHNGVFTTLEEVMTFYNIPEKISPDPFPLPEVIDNISTEVDFLDLADTDISNIIAFMKTLTDGTGIGVCF